MIPFADALTGGIIGGTLAAVVVFGLFVAAALLCFRLRRKDPYLHREGLFFGWVCAILAVATAVAWLWASWPLAYDYHHWVDKSGRVERVSQRLVSNGSNGMSQKFVVVIDGKPYGIDDTRAALIHKGDMVRLRCKKAYQYGVSRSAHGWDCRWSA